MKRAALALLVMTVLNVASTAAAGGYDIPILYSARHIGAAGAAVGGVDDSSAIFHNPAGMGQIGKGNLLLDVSLLTGDLRSTPYLFGPETIQSEPVVAPFFLVGGSGRVHEYITLGLAVYPVAAASGEYKYALDDGQNVTDRTSLIFMEASPAIALDIDQIGLRIGLGYRITFASLDRFRDSAPLDVDIRMTGFSFLGFRVGFQWSITDFLAIGMNYRTKTKTKIDQTRDAGSTGGSPSGTGTDFVSAETELTLPARLTGGLRFDWNQFSLMSDFEWGFNSQNDRIAIETVDVDGNPGSIANVFEWEDQWTLRTGVEYRVYEEKIPLRLGFIYDSKTTNFKYPSGFSTPPVHTYSLTAGIGYDHGPWEINIAYARRFGKVLIDDPDNPLTPTTQDDSLTRGELIAECPACGYAGDYRFRINGFYLDFSWDWK
jgi:long-subunit fatty acid transport protein